MLRQSRSLSAESSDQAGRLPMAGRQKRAAPSDSDDILTSFLYTFIFSSTNWTPETVPWEDDWEPGGPEWIIVLLCKDMFIMHRKCSLCNLRWGTSGSHVGAEINLNSELTIEVFTVHVFTYYFQESYGERTDLECWTPHCIDRCLTEVYTWNIILVTNATPISLIKN